MTRPVLHTELVYGDIDELDYKMSEVKSMRVKILRLVEKLAIVHSSNVCIQFPMYVSLC